MSDERLGDEPIEDAYVQQMNELARMLDQYFNGSGERKTGFLLMIFPLNSHEGRCNYISNGADRKDVVALFKEQIARFEGMPTGEGRA